MRTTEQDHQIISRYTDQPSVLPPELRRRIEEAWGGDPVRLYAFADLDGALRLSGTWVVLGAQALAIVPQQGGEIGVIPRARLHAVDRTPGLSATTLTLVGLPGEEPLAVVRYTHRQQGAFEDLCFVLEEQLEGRAVETSGPDRRYSEAGTASASSRCSCARGASGRP